MMLATAALAAASAYATPTVGYLRGHTDLSVDPAGPGVAFAFNHGAGVVFNNQQPGDDVNSLDTVFVRVPDSQEIQRPAGTQWDFLGAAAGETVFFLPQSSNPGVPWLGVASESLSAAAWQSLDITLDSVDAPAGAHVSLWQTLANGTPTVFLASADGVPDSFSIPVGGHVHYNWGFSEPGVYRLGLTAIATPFVGEPAEASATLWVLVGDDTTIPADPNVCPGDLDADGAVGTSDLLTLLAAWGTSDETGDADGDGFVGTADLLLLLAGWGTVCT
jgi:surface-anchored protein